MGHTLVAVFSEDSSSKLRDLLKKAGVKDACKVPFGRHCDRAAADRKLKHHITLFHWNKKEDDVYLKRLAFLQSIPPCRVTAVKPVHLSDNATSSHIVCLKVAPSKEFSKIICTLREHLQTTPSVFLHITLDATKDTKRVQKLCSCLEKMDCFPLELEISGLELYKIWEPVKLVNSYPISK